LHDPGCRRHGGIIFAPLSPLRGLGNYGIEETRMNNEELTRRGFVGLAAAGLAAATVATPDAQQQVVEKNVDIKTPDGTCDAAFIHPASGAHPAVNIWPDGFELRQSMRDMAKRR